MAVRVLCGRKAIWFRGEWYKNRTAFIFWLFNHHNHYGLLLNPELLNRLKARQIVSGCSCKLQDHLCAICRAWLMNADPVMTETCPIEFGYLTFKIFMHYLTTFKKREARLLIQGTKGMTVKMCLGASAFSTAAGCCLVSIYA